KARNQTLDLLEKGIAASIERRPVECRIAVQAGKSVAREHRPKRRRDGRAPLGVEPNRVVRDEAVHVAPGRHRTPSASVARRASRQLSPLGSDLPPMGRYGLTWDL